ncbi:hypothetical protein Bca52824_000758 [Brassica carinata]|uniref:Uncharacterized protein n=1 Tax=Brassica carinata TaxID=52824 RepID=A0A8X7WK45_BRACI|nr:hypothetical protein Bca52824_000758 [Brassica carinata]
MAVANLAKRCLNSKGKKMPNMRQVFTELEKICLLSEDSQVQVEIDDGDEDDEGMQIIDIEDFGTVAVTAPASSNVASSSSSDVQPLFPRPTW